MHLVRNSLSQYKFAGAKACRLATQRRKYARRWAGAELQRTGSMPRALCGPCVLVKARVCAQIRVRGSMRHVLRLHMLRAKETGSNGSRIHVYVQRTQPHGGAYTSAVLLRAT